MLVAENQLKTWKKFDRIYFRTSDSLHDSSNLKSIDSLEKNEKNEKNMSGFVTSLLSLSIVGKKSWFVDD